MIPLQEAESHFLDIAEIAAEQFRICQFADHLLMLHKKKNVRAWWRETDEVIAGTSNQDSFGLTHLMVRLMIRRIPKQGKRTYTPSTVHVLNTTAKRRGIAKMLLAQFKEIAAVNDVHIIKGDFNASAYRERGKAKLNSIEEAWKTTLLSPPPDVVPM